MSASENQLPANGRQVAECLYQLSPPESKGKAPRQLVFAQILENLAHDAVVGRFVENRRQTSSLASDMPDFSDLIRYFVRPRADTPYDPREYSHYVDRQAKMVRDLLANGLTSFTRRRTQTPHPTETLSDASITAVRELRDMLNMVRVDELFPQTLHNFSARGRAMLKLSLSNLYESLHPPAQRMTPEEEIARALEVFAKDAFDAIPEMLNQQQEVITALEEDYELSPLKTLPLQTLYHLLDNRSWSGSDRDGKPQVTVMVMEKALDESRRVVRKWYAERLKELFPKPDKLIGAILLELDACITPIHALRSALENYPDETGAFNNRHGKPIRYTNLQVLLAQMGNFGDYAAKMEVRENATVHRQVFTQLVELLSEQGIIGSNLARKLAKSEKTTDDDMLGFMEATAHGTALHRKAYDCIEQWSKVCDPASSFYQVLGGIRFAAKYPTAFPLLLIAECSSHHDLWIAYALLVMLTAPADTIAPLEIASLVEDRPSITGCADMQAKALSYSAFLRHHLTFTRHKRLLTLYDPGSPEAKPSTGLRALTVADVKCYYGLPLQEEDGKRLVEGAKVVMFAGSDSLKSSGMGINALLAHAQLRTAEALLNLPTPLLARIYVGAGGAVHRNNPVLAELETEQGRSLRDYGPYKIARKTVAVLADRMGKTLGHRITDGHNASHQVAGNLGGGQLSQGILWQEVKSASLMACKRYEQLVHDPRFATFMQYATAVHYTKRFNYSARPDERGKEKSTTALQEVNPQKLRAIGFGLALTASGSQASLFYGLSALLGVRYGHYTSETLDRASNLLRKSPEMQDICLRAAYGLIMADFDMAWAFAGWSCQMQEGYIYRDVDGVRETYPLAGLVAAYENNKPHPAGDDAVVLSSIYREYRGGLTLLTQLYCNLKDDDSCIVPLDGHFTREHLLSTLPYELQAETEATYPILTQARRVLCHDHRMAVIGKPDATSKEDLWGAFAAIVEATERAPAAMREPGLAAFMSEVWKS